MSKRSDCKDESQQPYTSTKCSKTCNANPCISGPSSLTCRTPSSPLSSSRTAPLSLSSSVYSLPSAACSAYSLPSTAYYTPSKTKYVPDEYPQRSRGGKLDKGKRRASSDDEESSNLGMIGQDATAGVHLVGGRHMMNYTGTRKKWSHGMVAKMRDEAAAQSNTSLQSSSQSLYSTDSSAAQPRSGRGGPGLTSRRDSMEPEALHFAQFTLAARPTSVLDRKRTQDLKERNNEKEMGSEQLWKFAKRVWTGFGRR